MDPTLCMPRLGRSLRVAPGTLVIDAVRAAALPLARACGGSGLCGRCGVAILAGGESVAPETGDEALVKRRNRIDPALRLACRVRVDGDLSIDAPYW